MRISWRANCTPILKIPFISVRISLQSKNKNSLYRDYVHPFVLLLPSIAGYGVCLILLGLLTFSRLMTYIYIYIYICRTAPLTSRCCILYIYSTNIRTEYFKHATYSPLFPLQNAVYFIMLPSLVPVLFTF